MEYTRILTSKGVKFEFGECAYLDGIPVYSEGIIEEFFGGFDTTGLRRADNRPIYCVKSKKGNYGYFFLKEDEGKF
jgi:hypothetical protein